MKRWSWGVNIALLVFLAIYLVIVIRQPNYLAAPTFLNFLRAAAPLVILACGQLFVVAQGGFDLSQGALVTLTVLGGSMLIADNPDNTAWAIALLFAIGLAAGVINGLVVSFLKVPSIIATLGMLLVLKGIALLWSSGAPRGYLPDNFRFFGRYVFRDVPVTQVMPVAVIALAIVIALMAWGFHRTIFGKRILAVGDNPRAAELAGIRVAPVRIACFVVSALSAVLAGVLLGGFAGVSVNVGDGLELQALSAVVLGGAQLMGGSGHIAGAVFGALSLHGLFTLLNLMGLPLPLRQSVQGLILIFAVASGALGRRRSA